MDCFDYKRDNLLGTNWTLDTLNIDLSFLTFRDEALEGCLLTHQALNIFIKAVPSEKLFGIAHSLLEKSCAFVVDDPTAIVKGHLAHEPWFIVFCADSSSFIFSRVPYASTGIALANIDAYPWPFGNYLLRLLHWLLLIFDLLISVNIWAISLIFFMLLLLLLLRSLVPLTIFDQLSPLDLKLTLYLCHFDLFTAL